MSLSPTKTTPTITTLTHIHWSKTSIKFPILNYRKGFPNLFPCTFLLFLVLTEVLTPRPSCLNVNNGTPSDSLTTQTLLIFSLSVPLPFIGDLYWCWIVVSTEISGLFYLNQSLTPTYFFLSPHSCRDSVGHYPSTPRSGPLLPPSS